MADVTNENKEKAIGFLCPKCVKPEKGYGRGKCYDYSDTEIIWKCWQNGPKMLAVAQALANGEPHPSEAKEADRGDAVSAAISPASTCGSTP